MRDEALNLIFTAQAMWTAGLVMTVLYAAVGVAVYRARAQLANTGGPGGRRCCLTRGSQ